MIRFKTYSILNLVGLSVSLCIALTIFLFANYQLSADKHIKNLDQIYLGTYNWANLDAPCLSAYENSVSGIEKVSIVNTLKENKVNVKAGDTESTSKVIWSDSNYLKVFELPIYEGDVNSSLKGKQSAAITYSKAMELFGRTDVIGESFEIVLNTSPRVTNTYYIELILEDIDNACSQQFDFILHHNNRYSKDKSAWSYAHYIRLKDGVNVEEVNKEWLNSMLKYLGKEEQIKDPSLLPALHGLFPYKNVYFDLKESKLQSGNKNLVYLFTAIGVLILFIAGFNFINLSSSLASKRYKEIGIRKTVGGSKSSIFVQFLGESVLTSVLSLILAFVLLEVCAYELSVWMGIELSTHLLKGQWEFIFALVCGTIVLGILAGIYPAMVLSSFQPGKILKGEYTKGRRAIYIRRTLITAQFVISCGLIVCSSVILSQLKYIQNIDLGFQKEQIAYVQVPYKENLKYEDLINGLQQSPYIKATAYGFDVPGNMEMKWRLPYKEETFEFYSLPVDNNYLDLMEIDLLKGRNFNKNDFIREESFCIINEAYEKMLGEDDIIGKKIDFTTVIGVCKDFYFHNPAKGHQPLMFIDLNGAMMTNNLLIKIDGKNYEAAMAFIHSYWKDHFEEASLTLHFLNESFVQVYNKEKKLLKTISFFSILAIFVACLGLFGLSIFMADQKKKEIGIRKVIGASEIKIIGLQTREFLVLLIIANLISWPIAYVISNNWLDQFNNHIHFKWYFFLISLAGSLAICILTVAFMSIKASRLNPVDVLKSE